MKFSILVVLLIVASTYASTYQEKEAEGRFIVNQITRIINQIRNQIRQAGLDPLVIDNFRYENKPVPYLVEVEAFLDHLVFTGLSNIYINRLNFWIFNPRFDFDLSLPELRLGIADSGINVLTFGQRHSAQLNGGISIRNIRLRGSVWFYLIPLSVRSIGLNFNAGVFQSDFNLNALGNDYSSELNTFFNVDVPAYFTQNAAEINRLLVQLAWNIIRGNLLSSYKIQSLPKHAEFNEQSVL
ncbi:uncharacterized protein LOC123662750 [Melitaea cinxia]|uniref:uncharacterized protein LOC123662750 n=1 Tax=Melitaea cinxia TaxID=113334 RepID=UPI001E26F7C0|nr:uncharacterized protein LOC123662750 [Melitaea cinxia]